MTETLFGGLLLAVLLFFAGRRLGLSGFWSAVMSGAVPFLAYLIYSTQHWGGGDVLAIHFAVYLATAGLLMVFGEMQRKNQKMHWAPRLIIWFFVSLVVLNAILLSVANRGLPEFFTKLLLPTPAGEKVHTVFPGVLPHDRNKSYEPHLQQLEQQRSLDWQVRIDGLDELREGKASTVAVTLRDGTGMALREAKVKLALWRMANSRDDRELIFKETEPGVYKVRCEELNAGRWLTNLHIEYEQHRYQQQRQLLVDG